jgi:hypothetical protein
MTGAGATMTATTDSDESEDVGTTEPAIDDKTDVPLEGSMLADDPRWVRM